MQCNANVCLPSVAEWSARWSVSIAFVMVHLKIIVCEVVNWCDNKSEESFTTEFYHFKFPPSFLSSSIFPRLSFLLCNLTSLYQRINSFNFLTSKWWQLRVWLACMNTYVACTVVGNPLYFLIFLLPLTSSSLSLFSSLPADIHIDLCSFINLICWIESFLEFHW